MLFKITWRPVEQQFETLMKEFRRHRKSVEKDTELAHFLEANKARADYQTNLEVQQKQSSGMYCCLNVCHSLIMYSAESERIRLLSLLSSVQWRQQHSRILDMKYPGTGDWILTHDVFEQWKSAAATHQQQCLWCYGIRKSLWPNILHLLAMFLF